MMALALFLSFFPILGGAAWGLWAYAPPRMNKNERNKANVIIQLPKTNLHFVKTKLLLDPSWTSHLRNH